MGAFQAIRDAEAVKNEQHFAEAKAEPGDASIDYRTPLDSISNSYKTGKYSGGEDRPTHNWRGRKIIKGFTTSQRIKGDQDRQDERDIFFEQASWRRLYHTQTSDKKAADQLKRSYDRHESRGNNRRARIKAEEDALKAQK